MSQARIISCTNTDYHAMRDSWSHTQLEDFIESPELFRGRYLSTPPEYPKKDSKAFDWGTVADAVLTNPEGMDAVMRIIPESVLNCDGHRKGAPWTRWAAQPENAGRILLKESECTEIIRAVQHCRANPEAEKFLSAPGEFQHTIKWLDDDTGLWLRCRIDKVSIFADGLYPGDIKTTRSVHPRKFSADAYEYGYARQAAWYWDGLVELGEEPQEWINIAIGKPDPQECVVFAMKEEAISLGRRENRKYLRELAERIISGDWQPRSWNQTLELDVPEWAYRADHQWSLT